MNKEQFDAHVKLVFERTEKVLVTKRNEYAPDADVYRNFNEGTGISLHNTNVAVAWEYTVKHLQSIRDMIAEIEEKGANHLTEAYINEKFGDVINYFILIEGMVREKLPTPYTQLVNERTGKINYSG